MARVKDAADHRSKLPHGVGPGGPKDVGPILSLFSGAGGLDLGFEASGLRPALALDLDPVAVETYNFNRPMRESPARVADLAVIGVETVLDMWTMRVGADTAPIGVIGGPPCQPFSLGNVHRFEDDPRARMPFVYASILKAFADRFTEGVSFFVMENVPGLLNRPHRGLLTAFESAFRAAGFTLIEPFVLDAQHFRVPQRRRRLFLIGFRSSLAPTDRTFSVPPGSLLEEITVRDAIEKLAKPMAFSRRSSPVDLGLHPNHWHMNPRSPKFESGTNEPGHHLGRSFRMLHWDRPSQTVAFGHREVALHPNGTRRLSVFEALLLQGFPPSYVLRGTLSDQIRLVSDAVPPPLAAAVAAAVAQSLEGWALARPVQQPDRNGHELHSGRRGVQTIAPKSTRA